MHSPQGPEPSQEPSNQRDGDSTLKPESSLPLNDQKAASNLFIKRSDTLPASISIAAVTAEELANLFKELGYPYGIKTAARMIAVVNDPTGTDTLLRKDLELDSIPGRSTWCEERLHLCPDKDGAPVAHSINLDCETLDDVTSEFGITLNASPASGSASLILELNGYGSLGFENGVVLDEEQNAAQLWMFVKDVLSQFKVTSIAETFEVPRKSLDSQDGLLIAPTRINERVHMTAELQSSCQTELIEEYLTKEEIEKLRVEDIIEEYGTVMSIEDESPIRATPRSLAIDSLPYREGRAPTPRIIEKVFNLIQNGDLSTLQKEGIISYCLELTSKADSTLDLDKFSKINHRGLGVEIDCSRLYRTGIKEEAESVDVDELDDDETTDDDQEFNLPEVSCWKAQSQSEQEDSEASLYAPEQSEGMWSIRFDSFESRGFNFSLLVRTSEDFFDSNDSERRTPRRPLIEIQLIDKEQLSESKLKERWEWITGLFAEPETTRYHDVHHDFETTVIAQAEGMIAKTYDMYHLLLEGCETLNPETE